MALSESDIVVGVVLLFKTSKICNNNNLTTNALSRNDNKNDRQFVCINVDLVDSTSVWAPLTGEEFTRKRYKRYKICNSCKLEYYSEEWRTWDSYLQDGKNSYKGKTSDFIASLSPEKKDVVLGKIDIHCVNNIINEVAKRFGILS